MEEREWHSATSATVSLAAIAVIFTIASTNSQLEWWRQFIIGICVVVVLWAVSHSPGVARCLPWWFHAASRMIHREAEKDARQKAIVKEETQRLAIEHEKKRIADETLRVAKAEWAHDIWTAGHYRGVLGSSSSDWAIGLDLNGPSGFDPSRSDGWQAQCQVTHELTGNVYLAEVECRGLNWFLATFPQDFEPQLTHPLPFGDYWVVWIPTFSTTMTFERARFKIDDTGRLVTRSPNSLSEHQP